MTYTRNESFYGDRKEIGKVKCEVESTNIDDGTVEARVVIPSQELTLTGDLKEKYSLVQKAGKAEAKSVDLKNKFGLHDVEMGISLPEEAKNLSYKVVKKILQYDDQNGIFKKYDKLDFISDQVLCEMEKEDVIRLAESDTVPAKKGERWQLYYKNSGVFRGNILRKNDSRRKLMEDLINAGRFRRSYESTSSWKTYKYYVPDGHKTEHLIWLMATDQLKGYQEIKTIRKADGINEMYSKATARTL